jgi:hypothetical protein
MAVKLTEGRIRADDRRRRRSAETRKPHAAGSIPWSSPKSGELLPLRGDLRDRAALQLQPLTVARHHRRRLPPAGLHRAGDVGAIADLSDRERAIRRARKSLRGSGPATASLPRTCRGAADVQRAEEIASCAGSRGQESTAAIARELAGFIWAIAKQVQPAAT